MQHGNVGRQNKLGNLSGEFTFLFEGKIIKRIKPPKCSKTYLQNIFNFTLFPWWYPRPSLKGGGAEVGGRIWKEGCVMAVITELRFTTCSGLTHPGITKLYVFSVFPNEVSRRFDEVIVHIEIRGTWPMATGCSLYHRPNHSSEFHIGSCQCPKTWLYRTTNVYQPLSHEQRIKIHHSCSCKLSVVHTRWRRNYLTIYIYIYVQIHWRHCIPCILLLLLLLQMKRLKWCCRENAAGALYKIITRGKFRSWQVANEIAKPQVSIKSNNSSTDWKNLQPDIEIFHRK